MSFTVTGTAPFSPDPALEIEEVNFLRDLTALETACAIDSTGLRTTRFNYYRKEKYKTPRQNVWMKMHALVGVRTHIIVALDVTEGSGADFPISQSS
ncbi:MAG: transposase [Acetobacteraceae bacterium]